MSIKFTRIACASVLMASVLACASGHAQSPGCRYVKLGTMPVTFDHNRPTVEGILNDQPAVMLVDTGAWSTSLTPQGAERLGLTARTRNNQASVIGVNGESQVKFARVSSVSIGGIRGSVQDLPVISEMQGGKQIDAFAGANFLFQADLELNLSKPDISFFQPVGCNQAFLGYWGKDVYFVEAKHLSARNRQMVFTVQVNGHDVTAMLDSGATASVIDRRAAAEAGVSVDSPGVLRAGSSAGIGANSAPMWVGPFDTLSIGAETLHKTHLFITDMTGDYQDGSDDVLFGPKMLLGADFLSTHHVLIAVSQNRIYISYLGGEVFQSDRKKAAPPPAAATTQTLPDDHDRPAESQAGNAAE